MTKATKKPEVKKVEKVWYAVEDYSNPVDCDMYPCESLEEAIKAYDGNFTGKLHAYKIVPLGEVEVSRKIEYKFKNNTNGK